MAGAGGRSQDVSFDLACALVQAMLSGIAVEPHPHCWLRSSGSPVQPWRACWPSLPCDPARAGCAGGGHSPLHPLGAAPAASQSSGSSSLGRRAPTPSSPEGKAWIRSSVRIVPARCRPPSRRAGCVSTAQTSRPACLQATSPPGVLLCVQSLSNQPLSGYCKLAYLACESFPAPPVLHLHPALPPGPPASHIAVPRTCWTVMVTSRASTR